MTTTKTIYIHTATKEGFEVFPLNTNSEAVVTEVIRDILSPLQFDQITNTLAFSHVTKLQKAKIQDRIKNDNYVILHKVLQNGESVMLDDHNGSNKEIEFAGLAILNNGYICPLLANRNFCLNKLYLSKDNELRLSTSSVAGNIMACGIELTDAVDRYNSELPLTGTPRKINTLVLFE